MDSFERFISMNRREIFACCMREMRNRRDDAEDLMQEALIRAFRYKTDRQPTMAWFKQIIRNHAIDMHRKWTRRVVTVGFDDIQLGGADVREVIPDNTDIEQTYCGLAGAKSILDKLKPDDAAAIVNLVDNGRDALSRAEKSRVHRLREKLQKPLARAA